MPLVEQGAGRDTPEDTDREIRQPVSFDVGRDDGRGRQASPAGQEPLGVVEAKVVEEHRSDDIVEGLVGEWRLTSVGANDVDLGPVATRDGGLASDERIGVHGNDTHPHAVLAHPRDQGAGDVAAAASEVEHPHDGSLARLEQAAERSDHAARTAEVPVGRPQVVESLDRSAAGASERVRPLRGFQADHLFSSPGRGPRFTRPIHIVVTARSGRGAAAGIGERLAEAFRRNAYRVHVRTVGDLSHTRAQLARDALDVACLIGIGGDHTLSELARVAHEARVPLLAVPAGFGNIFAKTFGLRPTVAAVTQTLEHGRIELVDVGLCGDLLFLSSLGFGFLEHVKLAVETSATLPRRPRHRYQRYVQAAARSIARTPLPTLRVDVDGRPVADRAPFVIVANVPTYRSFMPLVHDASPFDGLLDVFVAPEMSKTRLIAWLLGFLVCAPACRRVAVRLRAAQVSIRDGERRDDITVVPKAVPVLLPPR